MSRSQRQLAAVLSTILCAAPAAADPRFWRHDRALTTSPLAKSNPDISFAFGEGAGSAAGITVVVYEQLSAASPGDKDIWLLMSDDFGCTWCEARSWAAVGNEAETLPRVAAGIVGGVNPLLSIQVIHERGGQVYVTHDTTIDLLDPIGVCRQLFLVNPTTTLLSRPGPGSDSRPRIARATDGFGFTQFHAVWQRTPAAGMSSLEYASDLAGDGSWALPGRDLSTELGGVPGSEPDITADIVAAMMGQAAPTIFFHDLATGGLAMVRSNQDGTAGTWTAPVSVSATSPTSPTADTSSTGFGEITAWNGCAWRDHGTGEQSLDAAFFDGAPGLSRSPDFESPGDHLASAPPATPGDDAAFSIGPMFQSEPVATFLFWPTGVAPAELVTRPGLFDPTATPPRDLDTFPFTPTRAVPPDPTIATVLPLTMCDWDETTGDCVPAARPPASIVGASEVASADTLGGGGPRGTFAVVFADDRSGESQIYFKNTDSWVQWPAVTAASASCEDLESARVDVTFDLVDECPQMFADELIERYLVHYGTAGTAGPYPDRLTLDNIALSDPTTVTVAGLSGGTSHDFVVVAEDQARNVYPPAFDPSAGGNFPQAIQTATVATPSCTPALTVSDCSFIADRCGITADGTANPGDVVQVRVTLDNIGDWDAAGISGTAVATGAFVTSPADGDLATLGLAATVGGSAQLTVEMVLDPTCPAGSDPTLTLSSLASFGGRISHGSLTCPSPVVAVDCTAACAPACDAMSLQPLADLLAVKDGASGARFRWSVTTPDAAVEMHVNAVRAKTELLPPGPARPPTVGGLATGECDAFPPALTCDDVDALTVSDPLLYYRVVGACSPLGTHEGPH